MDDGGRSWGAASLECRNKAALRDNRQTRTVYAHLAGEWRASHVNLRIEVARVPRRLECVGFAAIFRFAGASATFNDREVDCLLGLPAVDCTRTHRAPVVSRTTCRHNRCTASRHRRTDALPQRIGPTSAEEALLVLLKVTDLKVPRKRCHRPKSSPWAIEGLLCPPLAIVITSLTFMTIRDVVLLLDYAVMSLEVIEQGDGLLRVMVEDKPLTCLVCGSQYYYERGYLLNTRSGEFLGLAWTDDKASNFICARCGYIFWFHIKDVKRSKSYESPDRSVLDRIFEP
jgi:hypothetical protein